MFSESMNREQDYSKQQQTSHGFMLKNNKQFQAVIWPNSNLFIGQNLFLQFELNAYLTS